MTSFTDRAYTARVHALRDLEPSARAAMERLYLAHYDATSPAVFRHDLAEKDEALVVRHGEVIVGFTTLATYPFVWENRTIRVVFSGDTVVDRRHWGQQALGRAWIARVGRLSREFPDSPLRWFLLVKGHRTYRYLPGNFSRFFPHWEREEPALSGLARALARDRFGEYFREKDGLVVFPASRGQLKSDIAEPDAREREKPPVRFFLERNPGFRQGHEMVCVCPLEAANFRPAGRRMFLESFRDPG